MSGTRRTSGKGSAFEYTLEQGSRKHAPIDDRVIYVPRSSATPRSATETLAAVYAFIIQAHRKKVVGTGGVEEDKYGYVAEPPRYRP